MAKRYQPLKEFGIQPRLTKKPKLDITINKGPRSITTNAATTSSAVPYAANNNDLWDDDDDEVILLATQVAENQACVLTQQQQSICAETEITFSDFAPHVHASTSTQRPPEPLVPDIDILTQIFCDDDDDDDFAMVAAAVEKQVKPLQVPEEPARNQKLANEESEDIFKKPTKLPPNEDVARTSSSATSSASQSEARRQLASERQIKFLMERVDTLKKEKVKLCTDVEETKSKLMMKDGETSLLRDEIRHLRQENHQLKLTNIEKKQPTAQTDDPIIEQLNKQISVKESALQMRSIEYMNMRMKHADELKRNQSMLHETIVSLRNESMMLVDDHNDDEVQVPVLKVSRRMSRSLMRLRQLNCHVENITSVRYSRPQQISELIFDMGPKRETSAKQCRTLFQLEFEQLQNSIAKLQLVKQQQHQCLTAEQLNEISSETLESVCKVFPEVWSYVHSLEYPKNCRIYPYHSYQWRSPDPIEDSRHSIHQPRELHEEERAITLRRYVGALSVLCDQMTPAFTQRLVTQRHGEYVLMQIAIDAIAQLGFSREICEHFGLLEAFAKLLRKMLKYTCASVGQDEHKEQSIALLMNMLKQVIFTRPSPWIFREISFALLECVNETQALALLCVNSDSDSFVSDRVKSIYRFSNESCVLQVYAGLLEIAFPLHSPLSGKRFELLTVICRNHVRFVYYCFANPPKFIHCRLPSFDDDDINGNGTTENDTAATIDKTKHSDSTNCTANSFGSTNTSLAATKSTSAIVKSEDITCECYTKLCLSVVTLLFQVLCEWSQRERFEVTARISEISKISVQLLHIIFCDNYITQLFRDAEETTKHYLFLICKWWQEHAAKLQFNQIQLNFLSKLQDSHVMPKSISKEGHMANIGKDLTEWYRLSKEDVAGKEEALRRDPLEALKSLRLMETAADPDNFFVGLNGYAFNFE